jgi:subtilisin family serine protease
LDYRDDIALVDLPPEVSVLVQSVLNLDLAATPEITAPEATAPAICIVDSGIVEGHPLLADAIISSKSRSFPESLGPPVPQPPVDKAGHGTHVSGVALYGDVGGRALAKEFSPELWLINARILDDENQLDPARMPFVGDIAEHARDRCRIFNLSFGFSAPGGFMSQYAVEMDEIARERDVLFVVSSGNRLPDHSSEKPYPEFLKHPAWSVLSPAEALNALTVGGITPDRDPYPHAHRKAMAPQALAFSLLALLRDQ